MSEVQIVVQNRDSRVTHNLEQCPLFLPGNIVLEHRTDVSRCAARSAGKASINSDDGVPYPRDLWLHN